MASQASIRRRPLRPAPDFIVFSLGAPNVGGFLEPVTILAVLILAVLVRHHRSALRLTLVAAGCLLLAFPVVFFWRVAPANAAFLSAAATGILPPDWSVWRTQWETGHAIRFGLHLIAFVLIAVALTSKGPDPRRTQA